MRGNAKDGAAVLRNQSGSMSCPQDLRLIVSNMRKQRIRRNDKTVQWRSILTLVLSVCLSSLVDSRIEKLDIENINKAVSISLLSGCLDASTK